MVDHTPALHQRITYRFHAPETLQPPPAAATDDDPARASCPAGGDAGGFGGGGGAGVGQCGGGLAVPDVGRAGVYHAVVRGSTLGTLIVEILADGRQVEILVEILS